MALNKVIKQVTKSLSPRKNTKRGMSRRQQPKRRRRLGVARGPPGILAGYGSPIQATYRSRNTPDGCIVSGFDLVTSFDLHDYISYYMPANPLWWQGTRIAAQARAYQNYRPLKFIIHYRPQVGSTSELSMFIGTIWQGNSINVVDSIEPSLVTSPGGVYLPSWNDSMTHVQVGTHLPQRMFPVNDKHFTTVPFTVIARSSAGGPSAKAAPFPGRIFIEYSYEFRNAIGGQAILRVPKVMRFYFVRGLQRETHVIIRDLVGRSEGEAREYNRIYEGHYRGRIMDVSEYALLQSFGINSEAHILINGLFNAGGEGVEAWYPASDSANDGNMNFEPDQIPQILNEGDLDQAPYIVMYVTDYPDFNTMSAGPDPEEVRKLAAPVAPRFVSK